MCSKAKATVGFGICVLCLGTLIACSLVLWMHESRVEDIVADPLSTGRAAAPGASEASSEDTKGSLPLVNWERWRTVNPDIIGWITVPETNIDGPVVQARPENPAFYLNHDVFGDWNEFGCAYLDAACAPDGLSSRNVVISGHNMGWSNAVFADLQLFGNEAFARSHRTIVIQTPERTIELETEAVDIIDGSDPIKRISFSSEGDFARYRAERVESSDLVLDPGENKNATRPLFTFCTCSYVANPFDERTLVYAAPALENG